MNIIADSSIKAVQSQLALWQKHVGAEVVEINLSYSGQYAVKIIFISENAFAFSS